MPGPPPVPVAGDTKLPEHVDVVVIGGGIIGTSTALELSERGHRVALCEKGGIAHEQSSRNWGWVRMTLRDPREIPLMAEAIRVWQRLDARIGRDTGYAQAGIVYLAKTEDQLESCARWARHVEPHQIPCQILDRAEVKARFPEMQAEVAGALSLPMDGRAEPQKAAPAIAEAAREAGAAILTRCAVRGIETSAGAVSGVVTERGRIACEAVVLAGGAWSNLFCGNTGLDLPQLCVINHVLRTVPVEGGPEPALKHPDFSIRKRQDGGYTVATTSRNVCPIVPNSFRYFRQFLPALRMDYRNLQFRLGAEFFRELTAKRRWAMDEVSPFEETRVLDPATTQTMNDDILRRAGEVFPALKDAGVAQRWAGCIDVTPDAIPVISKVETLPGFHIATGFSGHGFGIGPSAGRLMADLVTGARPCVDAHEFRFSRFTDGTRVRPIATI
ncbi:MAG: FAD-binding oxidoreductase [Pseudomonadota bacterium]